MPPKKIVEAEQEAVIETEESKEQKYPHYLSIPDLRFRDDGGRILALDNDRIRGTYVLREVGK